MSNLRQIVNQIQMIPSNDYQFYGNRIYMIVGPQTNISNFNEAAFQKCKKEIKTRSLGGVPKVETSFDLFQEIGKHPSDYYMKDTLNKISTYWYDKGHDLKKSWYDAIVVLPGWEKSQGAAIEVLTAYMCGIPLVEWIG